MIRIIARHVVKKECIGQYQALARELADATRKEKGCILYVSNQSIQDEKVHCFLEDWEDQASIDAHNNSEHFKRIVPQFEPLFDSPGVVELFTQIY